MEFLYSPLLLVTALFETRSSREVSMNRSRGKLNDDRVGEWEQMGDAVDFESEGWAKEVQAIKSNIEDGQADLEVRQLRSELKEIRRCWRRCLMSRKGRIERRIGRLQYSPLRI